jgi:hypothetical protein
VLFEHVNDKTNGGNSIEGLDRILSNVSVPRGLAHSDIKTCFADMKAAEIADLLLSRHLFVELNTALPYRREGLTFYEHAEDLIREFRGKVKLSIGTDVHRRLPEVSNVQNAHYFVRRLDLIDDLLF